MADEVAFVRPTTEIITQLPVTPIAWRVLLRCYEAPTASDGGILYGDDTRDSEELLSYVGQIVDMGSECFKLTTRSGIDMSKITPKPKVGDWVMYGTYGGQTIRTKTGTKYVIMNDDCIMGIVDDPHVFRVYI